MTAAGDNPPVVDNGDSVTYLLDLAQQMAAQQDCGAEFPVALAQD